VAGSESSEDFQNERAKLIQFPRSPWVPPDGIEPLNGADAGAGTAMLEPEPDEQSVAAFWSGGDTQEFVGLDPGSGSGDTDDRRSPMRRKRRPGVRSLAALAGAGLAAAAIGAVVLGGAPGRAPQPAAFVAHRASPAEQSLLRLADQRHESARSRRMADHSARQPRGLARHHKHSQVANARALTTSPGASTYASSAVTEPPTYTSPPVYESSPSATTAASSSAAASTQAGPTGPGALTGAGSTPSG
jgi:hypothetical protein